MGLGREVRIFVGSSMFDCSGFGALGQLPGEEEDVSGRLGSLGDPGDGRAEADVLSDPRATGHVGGRRARGPGDFLHCLCNFSCESKMIPN